MTDDIGQNGFSFKPDNGNQNTIEVNSDQEVSRWSFPQRTHVLSVFIHASKLIPIFAAFYLPGTIGGSSGSSNGSSLYFFAGYVLLIFIFWFISWRFRTYWIDQNELIIQHRFITKNIKHLPIDRIQSIDIIEPLLGRIMGLAALRITSGATSMSGKSSLAYLKVTEARELRELLLNRRKIAVLPDAGTQVLNARSFNTEVVSYPIYDVSQLQNETSSYWFQMSSGQLIATIITPFIIPSLLIALIEIIITLIAQSKNAVGISVGITIPIIVSLGSELWRRFSRLSGYKIDIMNDSLRITSGLLTVNHETIPFNRVQALRIEQPMLWKLLRLYRLQINLAGTSNKTRVNRQNLTIIPACSFYTAVSLIKNIQPEFDLSVPMISPPKIAFIKGLFWANVHRLGLTKETAVLSYGIVKKRWDLIYFGKIQSLRIKTGPVNKLLKLNNLYIDSTKGPIQFRIKWRSDNDTSEVSKFIADSVAVWFANNH